MLSKLDKKTKLLLIALLISSVIVCIAFISNGSSPSIVVAITAIAIAVAAIVIQINLDKRFVTARVERLAKSLTKQNSVIDVTKRELSDINSQFVSSRTVLQGGLARVEKKLETNNTQIASELNVSQSQLQDSLIAIKDSVENLPQTPSSRNALVNRGVKRLGQPRPSANTQLTHGRGAAAVARDPQRVTRITERLTRRGGRPVFVISTDGLLRYINANIAGAKTARLSPSGFLMEFERLLSDSENGFPPLLIIESKFLESGVWGPALSSSGTDKFSAISSFIAEIRQLDGFSVLVGAFEIKNTYTRSLESLVDIQVLKDEFEDDWSSGASLAIPRILQNYLNDFKENSIHA